MATIHDHAGLIAALGGPPAVATHLGVESINVRQWRARNRIPPEHWASLIALADRPEIDAAWMLEAMPDRKPPARLPAQQAAA